MYSHPLDPCPEKEKTCYCETCGKIAEIDTVLGLLCDDCYEQAVKDGYLQKSKSIYELAL